MAATADAKTLVLRHFERAAERDLEGAAELYASDIKFHGLAPQALDRAGWKQAMTGFATAFPDARFTVDEVVAEGDRVVVRHTLRGTHKGDFQGIPPTGRPIAVTGIVVYRVAGGQIVEAWLNADFLGLLQQLGAIPAPES